MALTLGEHITNSREVRHQPEKGNSMNISSNDYNGYQYFTGIVVLKMIKKC